MSLLSFVFLFSIQVSAHTLRELAQTSNLLLVVSESLNSDNPSLKKNHCGLNNAQISEQSQKLKSLIDEKISKLTDADVRLIQKRLKTCEKDCTCDIYALALEKKQININGINNKISQITIEERIKCSAIFKDICEKISKVTGLKYQRK